MNRQEAHRAQNAAEAAFEARDIAALEKAVSALLRAVEGATDTEGIAFRARGFFLRGMGAIELGEADQARIWAEELDALLHVQTTPPEMARAFAPDLEFLLIDLARLERRAPHKSATQIFAEFLTQVTGLPLQKALTPQNLQDIIPDPSTLSLEERSLIAFHVIVRVVNEAFRTGRSGSVIAWLDAAEPFLHGLKPKEGMTLLMLWGSAYRMETARRVAHDAFDDSIERNLELCRSFGFPEQDLEAILVLIREIARIDRALLLDQDRNKTAKLAREFIASGRLDTVEPRIKDFYARLAICDASLFNDERRPDSPSYGVERLIQTLKMMEQGEAEGFQRLLELTLEDGDQDHHAAMVTHMVMAQIFEGEASSPPIAPFAAIVALKIGLRRFEEARLDIAANARGRLWVMEDSMISGAYEQTRRLLVSEGRISEAIRVETLLHQQEEKIPRAASDALARKAAERMPIALEEEAFWRELLSVARFIRRGKSRLTPEQWLFWNIARSGEARRRPQEAPLSGAQAEPGVARIGYLLEREKLILRCDSPAGVLQTDVPQKPGALAKLIFEFEWALRSRESEGEIKAKAQGLYKILIAPARPVLSDSIHTLVIEGTPLVARAPFAALHDGSAYLVERWGGAFHAGALSRPTPGGPGAVKSVASFAAAHAPEMRALPRTLADRELVRSVAQELGYVALGAPDAPANAATLHELLRATPHLLHLSAHFNADPTDMGKSYFLLDDGSRIFLQDFAAHDLTHTELALLMGCETSSRAGEGASLDMALLRLGVASVLGALWPISDSAAEIFLKGFLEAHLREGVGKAEALRRSQLELLRNKNATLRHPHFWAAYALSGHWA